MNSTTTKFKKKAVCLHHRSFNFKKAIVRQPAESVINGLRDGDRGNPNFKIFQQQHENYVSALIDAGLELTKFPPNAPYPDSVFVEDPVLCVGNTAIILRPGAFSRFGEAETMRQDLEAHFNEITILPGPGFIDGGDILLSEHHAFIGLSERTDKSGFEALSDILCQHDYKPVQVTTPADILHFKTECGLLDSRTIFATRKLAATGCFDGYDVILVPDGEEAAANIVRVNDVVLISAGYPISHALLIEHGYCPIQIDTGEAAKIDGGLSCMSLRF